ncbi:MAG: FAD-dependent oxidoreductase [Alphaproteobacteria bacterium]|nr:FAD-dependent oxidoreductase [Alphaproteobacteria bacterium]
MADAEGYIDHNYYVDTLQTAPRHPVLGETVETDVCVVGGGLAGLNTALGLLERGQDAVVVEAKRIGWGASGRNAGFVAKGYSASEMSLLARLEKPHAQQLVTLTQNARKLIHSRIEKFNIDCGPLTPGVLTVSWKDNAREMRDYIDKANDVFHTGFEFWDREKVREHCKTQRYFDGVYSPQDYQFNPLRYLHGIAKVITEQGGRIFENSPAVKISRDGKGWKVETKEGCVKAREVVLCCSIYIDGLDKRLANAAFPVQTYIMVTKPIDDALLEQSLNTLHAIYDMRFCSDYYRRVDGNRILWGGRVALWSRPDNIAGMMLGDLLKVYPQLKGHAAPDYYWSGLLCYAPHKMPQLGQIEPGYWYNTGFGGHGLAPTTACGEVVASAIAEGDETWRAFEPFGIGFAGGKSGRYVAQMVYWWWRARDLFLV